MTIYASIYSFGFHISLSFVDVQGNYFGYPPFRGSKLLFSVKCEVGNPALVDRPPFFFVSYFIEHRKKKIANRYMPGFEIVRKVFFFYSSHY